MQWTGESHDQPSQEQQVADNTHPLNPLATEFEVTTLPSVEDNDIVTPALENTAGTDRQQTVEDNVFEPASQPGEPTPEEMVAENTPIVEELVTAAQQEQPSEENETIEMEAPQQRYPTRERLPPSTLTYTSMGQPEYQRINPVVNSAMVTQAMQIPTQPVPMWHNTYVPLQPMMYPLSPMLWNSHPYIHRQLGMTC